MDNQFLPVDYKVPKTESKYMRFKQGQNKFRILSSPIIGIEGWTVDKKPVRVRMNEKLPNVEMKKGDKVKHFWAMPVYNYAESKIQILEITQSGIQAVIKEYVDNEDWGSPLEYDLTVNRVGELLETEYTVIASPAKALNVIAQKMWTETQAKGFNLNKLFTNENPFGDEPIEEEQN